MASFTTRVELHHASESDYTALHSRMAAEGFRRTITADGGATYHLPTAEYDISGSVTLHEVLGRAQRAVRATGRTGAVLVTEAIRRTWERLSRS